MKRVMRIGNYQALCINTAKNFLDRPREDLLANFGLGVAGEAGDIAGCIKKTLYHKNDQMKGVRENIGDTLWYLAMICNTEGWKLSDIMEENIAKLKERFPEGFTEQIAQRKRIDWMEK